MDCGFEDDRHNTGDLIFLSSSHRNCRVAKSVNADNNKIEGTSETWNEFTHNWVNLMCKWVFLSKRVCKKDRESLLNRKGGQSQPPHISANWSVNVVQLSSSSSKCLWWLVNARSGGCVLASCFRCWRFWTPARRSGARGGMSWVWEKEGCGLWVKCHPKLINHGKATLSTFSSFFPRWTF